MYLVIVLHGYYGKVSNQQSLKNRVQSQYGDAKIVIPDLKLGLFSKADPNQLSKEIIQLIDEHWATHLFDKLIIIGHSCGGLLARKVYVYACGENSEAPFELKGFENPKPWAKHVERLVLLAGMNRGWSINRHLSLKLAIGYEIGMMIISLLAFLNYKLFIAKFIKGAPFITQLRIQWLAMMDERNILKKEVGNAIVIQLLGTIDDLVSPDDNLDLVTGSNFYYLEVPMSGHMDVLQMSDASEKENNRGKVFTQALTFDENELKKLQVNSYEQERLIQRKEVTDVVFVIHGIRDAGFWTKKIARRVQGLGNSRNRVFQTETSSYGYFPMLSFLLYPKRREKVQWLMDQYTENRALYPNAEFSFVGHSNGTYLLARALEDYPACRFKNVVFAGSVVRSSYDWNTMIVRKRINSIVNLVASADWVVAIFPKALQTLRLQDLGSGGHDGFSLLNSDAQLRYLKGSHSVGIKEELWDTIAGFIVDGGSPTLQIGDQVTKQNLLIKTLGVLSPLFLSAIICALIYLGYLIWGHFAFNKVLQLIAISLYVFSVWKIITKL